VSHTDTTYSQKYDTMLMAYLLPRFDSPITELT